MKKLITKISIGAILAITVLGPITAHASGTEQQRIAALEQLIVLLQAQLNELLKARSFAPQPPVRHDNIKPDTKVVKPKKKPTVRQVWCERAYHVDQNAWVRVRTTWNWGQHRSNGRYSSTDECRKVEYYKDGSGFILDQQL